MVHIGIVQESDGLSSLLVLNGRIVSDAGVDQSVDGEVHASVFGAAEVTVLLDCSFAEIISHFMSLILLLPTPPSEVIDSILIGWTHSSGNKNIYLSFQSHPDLTLWTKPWSMADFASTLKRVIENRSIPELRYRCSENTFIFRNNQSHLINFSLRVEPQALEVTMWQALQHWFPIIKDLCEEADAIVSVGARDGALVYHFLFAPEVKAACEQYLLYFGQFLQDLGIQATVDLQEQAREVLFTVTPTSGPEALGRIREALDVYLEMPRSPDFDAEVTRHTNIAVQQYAANVLHLRSQLALAQAVLETKNATIEALQAANFQYRQLLNDNPRSQGQLPAPRTDTTQQDETILGGTVTITKANWKGLQVNFPYILRELRRRWNRED